MKETEAKQGGDKRLVRKSTTNQILNDHLRLKKPLTSLPLLLIFCSLLLGFSATFITSHWLILHSDKHLLNAYQVSASKLNRQLKGAVFEIFKQTAISTTPFCSPADLKMMRSYLWTHPQLKDIARMENGRVLCSASWGVFSTPFLLSEPTYSWEEQHYYHWRNVKYVVQARVDLNIVAYNNTLVVISPSNAHSGILPIQKHVGFIVSSPDGYVAYTTGPLEAETVLAQQSSLTMLIHQTCESGAKIPCITVYNSKPGLLGKDNMFIVFVGVIALVISALVYVALLAFINYRHSMKKALRRAIARQELFVDFQPKVQLNSGMVVGVEALARWNHKQFGSVPPDVFIIFAEENGLMPQLSRLIIEQSLSSASNMLQDHPRITLSINLTMADLSDPMLLDFIDYHRQNNGIETGQLIFEITETSAAGFDEIEASVERFASRGYKISLDDFGTGYANLSWLSRIKAAEIKVDKIFTQMIGSQDKKPLDAIFHLLSDLKVTAVFEGIENKEQVDYILSHIPEAIGQGWLFARPMPIEELSRFNLEAPVRYSHVAPASAVNMQPLLEC